MTGIIDEKGFRLNVGIIIAGQDGRVFWGRRVGNRDAWQFPQGGMMVLVLPATNRRDNQSFRIYSASPTTFLEWICPQLAYVSRSTSRHGQDFGRFGQSGSQTNSDFGKCSNRQSDITVRQGLAWEAKIRT